MNCGIYRFTNTVTGQSYVGSSERLSVRNNEHLFALKSNRHPCQLLQASWDEHGPNAFEFVVVEYCAPADLVERELWWFGELKPAFNRSPYAPRGVCLNRRTANITLPPELVKRIDEYAASRCETRSQFLQIAALERLARLNAKRPGRAKAGR